MGSDTSNHRIVNTSNGPMLIYNKQGQSELGTMKSINKELDDSSVVGGLFKDVINEPVTLSILSSILDYSFADSRKMTITQKMANALGANIKTKDVESRLLVMSIANESHLINIASSN